MANVSPMDRLTTDHAALERAVAMYRSASAENFRGVDSMLANGTPWSEVAEYASYHCQVRNLGLPPWQPAPCKIDDIAAALKVQDPQRGYRAAAMLLQRMLRNNLSRFEPDPVAAFEVAEAEQRRAAG